MSINSIASLFAETGKTAFIIEQAKKKTAKTRIEGLLGSSISFLVKEIFTQTSLPLLLLVKDKEEAAYLFNDLELLINKDDVLFYPSSYKKPYEIEKTDNANVLLRSEVLNRLHSRKKPALIVTHPEALFEKVITQKELEKNTLKINEGDNISIDFINEILFEYHFKRVDFVSEPGEFSLRGGIIDVFSFSNDNPYRIEFFGNEIESIRSFDVATQLSIEKLKKVNIIPNIEHKFLDENRECFFEYINKNTVLIIEDIEDIKTQLSDYFHKAETIYSALSGEIKRAKPESLFINGASFEKSINIFTCFELGKQNFFNTENKVSFTITPQPSFNKQFDLLLNNLNENQFRGYKNFIFCSNESQAKRFDEIFESINEKEFENEKKNYKTIVCPLYQGFIDEDNLLCCYTDHQIFERYHKFTLKNGYSKKQSLSLKELTSLSVGDYVTHIDHGIGKFGGLQKIDVEGKMQEAIKLVYADNDIVYVSIHSLHKIAKYNGKDGITPKIYKLGSGAWKALKQKTKARVKHIAFNLIQLYAKRRLEKGFAFAKDSYLQKELESSFIYEDTPDQEKATREVKQDMELDRPMDRLVCGDVGFGKTEVAIRAAFKAADNSKQVAVLVPTTILAYQHYRTFKDRLKDLPVSVNYINRFRTSKEKNAILDDLSSGKLDIIIGTHQLVNNNVKFKNLGLLIIDEEQKFGVNVKDKLKTLSATVDTLTLTATPIPRTLQFSLMAARDLSVITTPPPNRYPIETQVIRFQEELFRDAIIYEMQRGGQVFFVNNRIENIKEIAGMIQRLVPDAKVGIGHGQMEGKKLEEVMLAFMEAEFDVLIATTIIESGLDVPNANTIFINNAHQFGLADLHQMRGRVGRSNKKAFCYFITPPYSSMTEEARKRIQALEQFSELGSGFNIAMKDLEIRGAGDLLGGEQSGFINEIGFETYQKIMNEAIEELKQNEFKSLYVEEFSNETKEFVKDLQIDTDFELLFPDDYINSVTERLNLYNELNSIKDEASLIAYEQKLVDRFGVLPKPAKDLVESLKIKWKATYLGIEKLVLKNGKMVGYFIGDQESDFYQTTRFQQLLQYAQQNQQYCKLKEKETKNGLRLLITFEPIKTIQKALQTLEEIAS